MRLIRTRRLIPVRSSFPPPQRQPSSRSLNLERTPNCRHQPHRRELPSLPRLPQPVGSLGRPLQLLLRPPSSTPLRPKKHYSSHFTSNHRPYPHPRSSPRQQPSSSYPSRSRRESVLPIREQVAGARRGECLGGGG